MPLTNEEITELQKFKQHLQLLGKTQCQRLGDKTCIQIPDQIFCPSCYANSILQTSEQPIQTGEPVVIHLDPIATEPEMTLVVAREDKLYPLLTDDDARPGIATQEVLLRFMGVMLQAYGTTEEFKQAAAKWGLKFYLQK